jgi:hypothetical protein
MARIKMLNIETKRDKIEAQLKLKEMGYYTGPIDGLWGKKSEEAYKEYINDQKIPLAVVPKGDIPWWKTRRAKGLVTLILGGIVYFIPGAESFETGKAVDIVWSNIDTIESIIEQIGTLIAAGGLIWSMIGAKNAKAPIDKNLVAKIGEKEIRLPKKTYVSVDEFDNEKNRSVTDRARGWFADHS